MVQKFALGDRCFFETHKGTIRYIGEVPPTVGEWYGIEWDTARGKHDGTYNSVQYFKCKPNHGSFVRPNKLCFGISDVTALEKGYGNSGISEDEKTTVLNKSTRHETIIQMIGFEKISQKLSDFRTLQEVDLSNMNISHASLDSELHTLLPNLKVLSISDNLISSFKEIFKIASQMKKLNTLDISGNQINNWNDVTATADTFSNLNLLYINRMSLEWDKVLRTLKLFPVVQEVHACFNTVTQLFWGEELSMLKVLNLEGNQISSWNEVMCLSKITNLGKLILNNNCITKIDFPDDTINFQSLKSLSLVDNNIFQWDSINELNKLNSLVEIRFMKNPVCSDITSFVLRQELIARLPKLKVSNSSEIDQIERKVAEIDYLRKYAAEYLRAKQNQTLEIFERQNPQYQILINTHGPPDEVTSKTLKESLLFLYVKCPDDPSKEEISKQVPASTTVRQLKGILQRIYQIPTSKQKLSYFDKKVLREVILDDNMKQLEYYSMNSGDIVYLRL